ncbi:amino acid--tRNA ligase-related protein [Streptomyces sp. NPDC008150]|uniref:asparagine synthetase A n=1 Tax=Streptomyces sp. NPDC008150 TaxID=3364816 RepID=UPI0036EEBD04
MTTTTNPTTSTNPGTAPSPVDVPGRDGGLPPATREHLADPRTRAVLRVQHEVLAAAREYLTQAQDCTELLLPVVGPVTDPGARGAKQVDIDYYGQRYKLMTSAILYKQAALVGAERFFCIAPNVRLEPLETSNTSRHLAEFHQIDVELAGAGREEAMDVVQGVVRHVVERVARNRAAELAVLGRDTAAFDAVLDGGDFERRPHADAVAALRATGCPQSPDAEIDWQGEALISAASARPFFLVDYPKGSRGFYDRESRQRAGELCNFDLIAPEGYGELCSGSERESDYRTVMARIRETGENPSKYRWYLDMVREGIPSSAGFGIGVERLTRWVAGLDCAWQASAFPKVPGVVAP